MTFAPQTLTWNGDKCAILERYPFDAFLLTGIATRTFVYVPGTTSEARNITINFEIDCVPALLIDLHDFNKEPVFFPKPITLTKASVIEMFSEPKVQTISCELIGVPILLGQTEFKIEGEQDEFGKKQGFKNTTTHADGLREK